MSEEINEEFIDAAGNAGDDSDEDLQNQALASEVDVKIISNPKTSTKSKTNNTKWKNLTLYIVITTMPGCHKSL